MLIWLCGSAISREYTEYSSACEEDDATSFDRLDFMGDFV